ncbi:hypothetical protein VE04_04782 [Pseudogymnoascus sp. 24MN13]|nr:hypothetical protein VE04_04782 [Pseudogymnoascus sp. 24MN13]
MAQPPPPPHSDPNLPVENPEPLDLREHLDRKDKMALECAEVQHQRNIAVLKINLLRHETTLRIETERELERMAEKERERRRQAERDNNDTVDLVVELFTCVVLILLVAAVVLGPMEAVQRIACLLDL